MYKYQKLEDELRYDALCLENDIGVLLSKFEADGKHITTSLSNYLLLRNNLIDAIASMKKFVGKGEVMHDGINMNHVDKDFKLRNP